MSQRDTLALAGVTHFVCVRSNKESNCLKASLLPENCLIVESNEEFCESSEPWGTLESTESNWLIEVLPIFNVCMEGTEEKRDR